jgi:hypothetical protein
MLLHRAPPTRRNRITSTSLMQTMVKSVELLPTAYHFRRPKPILLNNFRSIHGFRLADRYFEPSIKGKNIDLLVLCLTDTSPAL